MSCPDQKAKSASRQQASSGVPSGPSDEFQAKGFTWRKVNGVPKPGRVYCFPGERRRYLVAARVEQGGYRRRPVITTTKYETISYYPPWYERVEQPEPDWLGEPADPTSQDFNDLNREFTEVAPIQVGDSLWRFDSTGGAFEMGLRASTGAGVVVLAFNKHGRRIRGLFATGERLMKAVRELRRQAGLLADGGLPIREEPAEIEQAIRSLLDPERQAILAALRAGQPVSIERLMRYPDLVSLYGMPD